MNITLQLTDEQVREIAEVVAAILRGSDTLAAGPDLVTLDDAATIAGVAPRTVANWRSRGRLTKYGVARKPLVSRAELLALLAPKPTEIENAGKRRRSSAKPRKRQVDGYFTGLAKEGR